MLFEKAKPEDFFRIKQFYWNLIDEMYDQNDKIGWKKGIIAGFCKADICGENGKLDYLVVRKEFRGKGYGKALMDWAMELFERFKVNHIEVKVVDGNETIHLYEKYGFQMNAHILVNTRQ